MQAETRDIHIDQINEPTEAMRSDIPRDEIFDLGADIKRNGLINPITVRPVGDRFEVVAGHRRYLAHRYTGLATIKCVVRELTDREAFAIMTSENLKRENVNVVDEAIHCARAVEHCNGDIDAAAKMCGESVYWVETRLRIAEMPDDYKEALRNEKIKLGVAMALSQIENATDRSAVLEMAISQGASVVMAQYWLAQWRAGLFGTATQNYVPDSNLPEGQRQVITLRCGVDGIDYPADEMRTVLVHKNNLGYVEALREHLKNNPPQAESSPGDDSITPQG